MARKFESVRPFNMARAVERRSNGLWTVELFTGLHGKPEVIFECEHGALWGRSMWAVWNFDRQVMEAREDYYAVPAYVKNAAVKMCREVWK